MQLSSRITGKTPGGSEAAEIFSMSGSKISLAAKPVDIAAALNGVLVLCRKS